MISTMRVIRIADWAYSVFDGNRLIATARRRGGERHWRVVVYDACWIKSRSNLEIARSKRTAIQSLELLALEGWRRK